MPPSHLGALESIGRICVVPFTKGPTFHFRWLVTATIIKTIRIGRAQEIRDVRGTCAVRANTERVKAVGSASEPKRKQHETRVPMAARTMGLEIRQLRAFGRGRGGTYRLSE